MEVGSSIFNLPPAFRPIKLTPLPHEFGLRINIVGRAFSATWIAGWEIGNVVRMKMKAMQRGDIPVSSLVLVRFTIIDGKLVGVGGRSYVTYVKRGEKESLLPNQFERFPSPDIPPSRAPNDVMGRNENIEDTNPEGANHQGSLQGGSLPQEEQENLSFEFFQLFMRTPGELKDELLRNYFIYISGLMSDRDFARKLRNIEERTMRGTFISSFA